LLQGDLFVAMAAGDRSRSNFGKFVKFVFCIGYIVSCRGETGISSCWCSALYQVYSDNDSDWVVFSNLGSIDFGTQQMAEA